LAVPCLFYKSYSKISEFNKSISGISIDEHFRRVVEKALDTYHQTNGLFDITVLPLVEAWGFGAKQTISFPHSDAVRALKTCLGSDALQLNGNKLIKSKPCVRIDVNGIAQGYTIDVLNDFIFHKNIRNYVIELGGELRVYGKKKPDSEPFRIGIETPPGNDLEEVSKLEKVLYMTAAPLLLREITGNIRKVMAGKFRISSTRKQVTLCRMN
jgi:thiamine biosynthesis lipoprotein